MSGVDDRQYDQSALARAADERAHDLEIRIGILEERSRWVKQGQTTASGRYVPWEAFRPVQRIVNLTVAAILGTLITLGLGLGVKWLAEALG